MHEIGIVDNIVCAIKDRLKGMRGSSRIKKVNILIGELEHVSPGHLETHFRERTKGTLLEGAELNFKKIKAIFKCKDCGSEFSGEEGMEGCPACKSKINDIIQGAGIHVDSVEQV